ncbi:MAG: hypothetical protein Q9224_001524 [Gallowayella concinna]
MNHQRPPRSGRQSQHEATFQRRAPDEQPTTSKVNEFSSNEHLRVGSPSDHHQEQSDVLVTSTYNSSPRVCQSCNATQAQDELSQALTLEAPEHRKSSSPSPFPKGCFQRAYLSKSPFTDFQTFITRMLEQTDSSSPDLLPGECFLDAWPLQSYGKSSDAQVSAFASCEQSCPLLVSGCHCIVLGGHEHCLGLGWQIQADDAHQYSKSIENPAGASLVVQTPSPQTIQGSKDGSGPAFTGRQPRLCDRDPWPSFEPLDLIDCYAPPGSSEPEYLEEMERRFVAGHHASGPAEKRHSHTANPQPFDVYGAESWTCYVCGEGSTEGDVWVQCSNEWQHQEADGWLHARCIGYTSNTNPDGIQSRSRHISCAQADLEQAPFLCHQCARKANAWDRREGDQLKRGVATSMLRTATSDRAKISGRVVASHLCGNLNIFTGESALELARPSNTREWKLERQRPNQTVNDGQAISPEVERKRFGSFALTLKVDSELGVAPRSGLSGSGSQKPCRTTRIRQVGTLLASHKSGQPRKKRKLSSQSAYKEEEKKWVVHYLKMEVVSRNLTESKWENISKELARHGFARSKCSIKAWWSRYGREETGFDERQNPTGRNMVTSKQHPADRKKARQLRKITRRAEETKLKQNHQTRKKADMNQGPYWLQGQEHENVYHEGEVNDPFEGYSDLGAAPIYHDDEAAQRPSTRQRRELEVSGFGEM